MYIYIYIYIYIIYLWTYDQAIKNRKIHYASFEFVICLFVIVATRTQAGFTFIKTKRLVLQPKYIGTVYVECHSSSIIYLITCNKFFTQYIGETVQKLNEY